ncbi:IQ calmodulin-binding motif-containing protein 1 isoform X2 [Oncorhynchus kisutch]|uniref:IQ calmodulin-binding motif-containing protein 1 isoform X2 n=1 Tax=Oncorhynchus kisutch TaxID=8019 RepID=UPI0012DC8FF3|nr:IQ calmodulin-binding motif-containing protein 1 isoform X2 [Oncorhynchus kisutch]
MSLARKDTDTGLRALVASTNIKPEQKVPQVLSKLQDILNRISVQDDGELGAFKNSLFSHGILQYCAGVALKLNYAKVEGGYATATQLAEILSSCCVGVDMGGDTEAFHRQLLPSVTDSLLSLASRLMNRALAGNGQPEMFRFFKKVMGSVCWLLKAHGHLATQGLEGMIGREWRGRGFDEDVDQLIKLLHREVPKPADHTETWPEECVRAACVIQAAWRSYQTRRRVKNLPRAVRSLQRSFRERRRRRVQQAQAVCWEEELRLQLCVRRQRARREFHQKQLQLLQLLPPGQVQQYLGEVERQAAIQIQRVWRGHRERRNFQQRRNTHTQHRAAVVLQRTVLRFLKRRRAEKAPPSLSPWNGPRGLTDSRRAELKREVEEHIALHPSSVVSLEGSRELHAQTQALLLQHLQGREAELREHTHTHALLAQINTDLELLLNAPSLSVATVTDCDVFRSRSAPVAARARQSHNALLQAGRLPWWKMLGDGDITCPESESAHKDHRLEAEFNSLYLGRS